MLATIGMAQSYEDGVMYGCSVSCHEVLSNDKVIFGVDEEQAHQLAYEFIVTMLEHRGLKING
ncbi:MAG: hypothetical protein RIM84_17830 [Alphaproteobacteria bacterium]